MPQTVNLVGISFSEMRYSEKFLSLLSSEENKRAEKFTFEQHRQRFVAFRFALKNILAIYIGVGPSLIELGYGVNQKPYLKNQPMLQFNLSHSGDEAIIALAIESDIGVDIEKNQNIAVHSIAERFFSIEEVNYINSLPILEQNQAFYSIWTHKEAFIKATGKGLSQDLKKFTIGINPSRLIHADKFDPNDWTIKAFNWKTGYSSAFATKQQIDAINYYNFCP